MAMDCTRSLRVACGDLIYTTSPQQYLRPFQVDTTDLPAILDIEMHAPKDLNPAGYGFFVFSVTAPAVALLAVSLRLWVRVHISKSSGIDDVLLLFSLVRSTDLIVILARRLVQRRIWPQPRNPNSRTPPESVLGR
jgi:hypothetical protein